MTTNPSPSAKEQVLAWVRSKNPASMELEFGCKVLLPTNFVTNNAYSDHISDSSKSVCTILEYEEGYKENTPSSQDWHEGRVWLFMNEWEGAKWYNTDDENFPEWEILGCDMGLPELLIALATIAEAESPARIHVDAEGHIWKYMETIDNYMVVKDIQFDLTKNLHNQAPEFYDSILPLIND